MAFIGSVEADTVYSNLTVRQTTVAPNVVVSAIRPVITHESGTLVLTTEDSGSLVSLQATGPCTIQLPSTVTNGAWFDVNVTSANNLSLQINVGTSPNPALMNVGIIGMDDAQVPGVGAYFASHVGSQLISTILPNLSASFKIQGAGGFWCVSGIWVYVD